MPTVEIYTDEPRQARINEIPFKINTIHKKIKDFRLQDKGVRIAYDLELNDTVSRQVSFERSFKEELEIEDKITKFFEKKTVYNLEIEEIAEKFTEKFFESRIEIQESLNKIYELNLVEELEIEELKAKELSKTFEVFVELIEIYLRHAGTVLSDLTLYNVALNETNFDQAITPVGYDRFKTMLTGDYIYQKALFRFILSATTTSGERPNAREYMHKVDVPDTFETGTIEFETNWNPATYEFSREFHIVPEVTYTIIRVENMEELNQAVVLPIEVTTKHIIAQLKVGSKYVNGAVSFSARGY